jgi:hypothetical protein
VKIEEVVPKCYETDSIVFLENMSWVNRRRFRKVKSLCPTTFIPSKTVDTNVVPARAEWSSVKLLTPDEGCGISNATHPAIIGGGDALIGEWPWMALLGYHDEQGKVIFRCAASIITSRHLLTAAHCLRRNL